ncbi:hypothetical protein V7S43_016303 [Phytophthora oleae]|uniref:Uncharacterized protein n=1 Tax=Phytophthora oleae TaxID=2107226 RepID=A0ABD3EVX4_9STRA
MYVGGQHFAGSEGVVLDVIESASAVLPDTCDLKNQQVEHEQVVLVGGDEDGIQLVEISNEYGGFTAEVGKAMETSGGEKLVIEVEVTVVEVRDLPAEVASTAMEDTQVVNAVTADCR